LVEVHHTQDAYAFVTFEAVAHWVPESWLLAIATPSTGPPAAAPPPLPPTVHVQTPQPQTMAVVDSSDDDDDGDTVEFTFRSGSPAKAPSNRHNLTTVSHPPHHTLRYLDL
jgi:hypothetical protein